MADYTLIANSGIQVIRLTARIEADKLRKQKLVYYEDVDIKRQRFWLEELFLIPDLDAYALKSDLRSRNALDSRGFIKNDADFSGLRLFGDNQSQVFESGNINQVLKSFQNKWLPIPFFKDNNLNTDFFGPTDWARIFIIPGSDNQLNLVLCMDTTTVESPSEIHGPEINENPQENKFSLCKNEDLILHFLDSLLGCQWVEDYLRQFFTPEDGDSQTRHIASYLYLLRILKTIEDFPVVQLISDKGGVFDVDMVIDVGNSKTCAMLFENPNDLRFNFNKVKQLELIDLTRPDRVYEESFSTKLVFVKPDFGSKISELNQFNRFKWPSFVRVGKEAERLINMSDLDLSIRQESRSYHSSPKRYLWDSEASEFEWTFLNEDGEVAKSAFIHGISEQLKSDGSLCTDGIFGTKSCFSKQSLMTFVFLEIITQATRQINSFEFRSNHGDTNSKRRLKRILISCPTAMIKEEQIALRKAADDAVVLFNNFHKIIKNNTRDLTFENSLVEVIPSAADLKLDLTQIERKKDWVYDEATSAQLLYLFSAINHKFDGNAELFFNLYGKGGNGRNKKLTIGSIDIGAGTSDLMICNYDYSYGESVVINPDPVYWESYNYAGDELLKEIIQKVLIEGSPKNDGDSGCAGVIYNYARQIGIKDAAALINGFFGKNNANYGYRARLMRISFINQIGIPLAMRYLEMANKPDSEAKYFTYNELFTKDKTNVALLEYFHKHFGFRFEELTWHLNPARVNEIIEQCFAKSMLQISKLMQLYACDIVVLSGRPFSLKRLELLLRQYMPVSPNRMINLNNYWIGKWYPFSDDFGYIKDPKTIVSVGSLIALAGGRIFKLENFKIDIRLLKEKLNSTARFIGNWKDNTIPKVFLDPEKEQGNFTVYDLPFYIGFKNLNSSNYPARILYTLQFNNQNIRNQLGLHQHINRTSINDEVENRKTKLRAKLPYNVTVNRDFERDPEKIKIEFILDNAGEDLTKSNLELKLQTLGGSDEYWLDSGEFNLMAE